MTYLSQTAHNIRHLLQPLEDAIRCDLIPALTGRALPNYIECDLFAPPARLGGLGHSKTSDLQLSFSMM